MADIVEVRRRGAKPARVTVRLVSKPAEFPFGARWIDFGGEYGHFTVEVEPTDRIAGLDLRPLVGLEVTVEDLVGDAERHQRLVAAVEAAGPVQLVVPTYDGTGHLSLRITRGTTTEIHAL